MRMELLELLLERDGALLHLVLQFLSFDSQKALSCISRRSLRSELRQLVWSQCDLRLPVMPKGLDWAGYCAATFLGKMDPTMLRYITAVSLPDSGVQLLSMMRYVPSVQRVRFWGCSCEHTVGHHDEPSSSDPSHNQHQHHHPRKQNKVMQLSELKGLTLLTDLDLSWATESKFADLGMLVNLKSLNLADTTIANIAALQHLTKLETLNLKRTRVSDISCVRAMPLLKWLDVSETRVQDFSALDRLAQLEYLNLSRNWVQHVGFLRDLPSLRQLKMNRVGAMDALRLVLNAPELEHGAFRDTRLTDLEFASSTPALTYLDIRRTLARNLNPLRTLLKLETLLLDVDALTAEEGMRVGDPKAAWALPLVSLKNLRLYRWDGDLGDLIDVPLTDGSFLGAFCYLERLQIQGLTDYAPLESSSATLRHIHLEKRWSTGDLLSLSQHTQLEKLALSFPSSPEIIDLSPLENFTELTELALVDVLFEDLTPLAHLPGLKKLDLSLRNLAKRQMVRRHRQSQDFSFLSSLPELEELCLYGRVDFDDASLVSGLPKIQSLILNSTKVEDVAPLAALSTLEFLHLGLTPVASIEALESLSTLQAICIPKQVDCAMLHDAKRFPQLVEIWHPEDHNCLWTHHAPGTNT